MQQKQITQTALLISMLLLSGCASNCIVETFYKPEAPSTLNVKIDRTETQILLTVADKVLIKLSECGLAYKSKSNQIASLCITVIPKENTSAQFLSKNIEFTTDSNESINYGSLEKFTYSIFCKNKQSESECSSDIRSNGNEIKRVRSSTFGTSYSILVETPADKPLQGVSDSQHGYIVPAWDKFRRYSAQIELSTLGEKNLNVSLPAIFIDGEKFVFPKITFREVTESICYRSY